MALVRRKVGIHTTKSPVMPRAARRDGSTGRQNWSVRGLPVTSRRSSGTSKPAAWWPENSRVLPTSQVLWIIPPTPGRMSLGPSPCPTFTIGFLAVGRGLP